MCCNGMWCGVVVCGVVRQEWRGKEKEPGRRRDGEGTEKEKERRRNGEGEGDGTERNRELEMTDLSLVGARRGQDGLLW